MIGWVGVKIEDGFRLRIDSKRSTMQRGQVLGLGGLVEMDRGAIGFE